MNAPNRAAIGHMNYPGDCVAGIETRIRSGWPMGPNYLGEVMWPVEATLIVDHNDQSVTTRVGFSLIPPPEVAEQMEALQVKQQRQVARLVRP